MALLREYEALDHESASIQRRRRALSRQIPQWTPLAEKGELLSIRRRIEELETRQAEIFAEVIRSGELALEQAPSSAEARALLAEAYATRLVEAEAQRDRASQRFFESRVRAYDDGSPTATTSSPGRSRPRSASASPACLRIVPIDLDHAVVRMHTLTDRRCGDG